MRLLQLDPGGEKFVSFIKRKIQFWHGEMERSGLATLFRVVQVDDGTTIYASLRALGNGQFEDKVRIVGGVGELWRANRENNSHGSTPWTGITRKLYAGGKLVRTDAMDLPVVPPAFTNMDGDLVESKNRSVSIGGAVSTALTLIEILPLGYGYVNARSTRALNFKISRNRGTTLFSVDDVMLYSVTPQSDYVYGFFANNIGVAFPSISKDGSLIVAPSALDNESFVVAKWNSDTNTYDVTRIGMPPRFTNLKAQLGVDNTYSAVNNKNLSSYIGRFSSNLVPFEYISATRIPVNFSCFVHPYNANRAFAFFQTGSYSSYNGGVASGMVYTDLYSYNATTGEWTEEHEHQTSISTAITGGVDTYPINFPLAVHLLVSMDGTHAIATQQGFVRNPNGSISDVAQSDIKIGSTTLFSDVAYAPRSYSFNSPVSNFVPNNLFPCRLGQSYRAQAVVPLNPYANFPPPPQRAGNTGLIYSGSNPNMVLLPSVAFMASALSETGRWLFVQSGTQVAVYLEGLLIGTTTSLAPTYTQATLVSASMDSDGTFFARLTKQDGKHVHGRISVSTMGVFSASEAIPNTWGSPPMSQETQQPFPTFDASIAAI